MNDTGEIGPIYGVKLIDTLPLNGSMMQQMPCRADLDRVHKFCARAVAGYEVLLEHYRRVCQELDDAREVLRKHHSFQENIGVVGVKVPSLLASLVDGQTDIDLSAKYRASELYSQTVIVLEETP